MSILGLLGSGRLISSDVVLGGLCWARVGSIGLLSGAGRIGGSCRLELTGIAMLDSACG